jgi:hypothetical protein
MPTEGSTFASRMIPRTRTSSSSSAPRKTILGTSVARLYSGATMIAATSTMRAIMGFPFLPGMYPGVAGPVRLPDLQLGAFFLRPFDNKESLLGTTRRNGQHDSSVSSAPSNMLRRCADGFWRFNTPTLFS